MKLRPTGLLQAAGYKAARAFPRQKSQNLRYQMFRKYCRNVLKADSLYKLLN